MSRYDPNDLMIFLGIGIALILLKAILLFYAQLASFTFHTRLKVVLLKRCNNVQLIMLCRLQACKKIML